MTYNDHYRKIELIESLLADRISFAFVRFGDGELGVIDGVDQQRTEWQWVSNDPHYQTLRQQLIQSLQYTHPDYYVGIEPGMQDIVGRHRLEEYYTLSGQHKDHILTANLFVNQNYILFRTVVVSLFQTYEIAVVCRADAAIQNLPFRVAKHFVCHHDAWSQDPHLTATLVEHAATRSNCLYLFMAGPFSNILIRTLHEINPSNIYIDIGSPLDPFLFNKNTRGYLHYYNNTRAWDPRPEWTD